MHAGDFHFPQNKNLASHYENTYASCSVHVPGGVSQRSKVEIIPKLDLTIMESH